MMGEKAVVDGWYAWLVCAASFLTLVIQGGLTYSMGVFYIMFQNALDASDSALSLVTSLNQSFRYMSCPFVWVLTDRYNERPLAVFGALLGTVGLVSSSFATEVYHLYISYSLLTGIGFGLVSNPCISIIGKYFKKYMKTAMGFVACGTGVGLFIFPPIIKALEDTYGWRGALLLLGGIYAHIIVFSCIYRPIPLQPVDLRVRSGVAKSGVVLSTDVELKNNLSSDAELKEVLPSDAELKEVSSSNDSEQNEILCSEAEEKDVLSSDAEQEEVLSINAEEKEVVSNDAEGKVVSSSNAEEKEVFSSDAEGKEILSSGAEEKGVLSCKAEQKVTSLSDAEQKVVLSSDAEEKELSIDAEQKVVLSSDSVEIMASFSDVEQKEVLSSDAEQKVVLSSDAEQKVVLSGDTEQVKALSGDAEQKVILSSDAEQKGVMSGRVEKKVVLFSGIEQKEVLFDYIEWKEVRSITILGMSPMQSTAIDDTKDIPVNDGEESGTALSENNQSEHSLRHDIASGHRESHMRSIVKQIISLFRIVLFSCLCLHSMLTMFSSTLIYTHFGSYVLTLGYSKGDVVYLYMTIGISTTVCRALIGFGAERFKLDPTNLVMGSAVINGSLTVLLPFFHQLTLLYVYSVIFAIMFSSYNTFCFPMLRDCVPKGEDATAYGIVCFFCVPSTAFAAPLAARLYEVTNQYASSFYLAGILFILAGLIMIPARCQCRQIDNGTMSSHQTQQGTKQNAGC